MREGGWEDKKHKKEGGGRKREREREGCLLLSTVVDLILNLLDNRVIKQYGNVKGNYIKKL